MNETEYYASEANFATHLHQLRLVRRTLKASNRATRPTRKGLSASTRAQILAKTAGRCHICGGLISDAAWHADHVLAHSTGGEHLADNYLPSHGLSNNYRWDYTSEEFQHILKLGVWLRTQIENRTVIGRAAGVAFLTYERIRQSRRVSATPTPDILAD